MVLHEHQNETKHLLYKTKQNEVPSFMKRVYRNHDRQSGELSLAI